MHELLDVVVDAPPLLDGRHDRGEVVVGEHHVGRLAGDVRAADAHRNPDVSGLHRRGIVDAVAGHRHDMAEALQRPHDSQLLLGRHTRVDHRVGGDSPERGVVERVDLRPSDGPRGRDGEAELAPHRQGRGGMVTGDHHRPDAGRAAPSDRRLRLLARWIDHADKPDEHELPLDLGGMTAEGLGLWHGPPGKRQHPHRPAGELRGSVRDLTAALIGERHNHPPALLCHAAWEHRLGRALCGEQPATIPPQQDHAHALADGVERDLEQCRRRRPVVSDASLDRGHDQAPLGRIAHHPPGAVRGGRDGGRRAAGCDLEEPVKIRIGSRIAPVVGMKRAARFVAHAAHGIVPLGGDDVAHRHLVAGQRAGLVGADDRHRPERLHTRQPAHEGVAPCHPLQTDRQHERHHRRQSLRYSGHRQADRSQQQIGETAGLDEPIDAAATNDLDDRYQADHDNAQPDQNPPQAGEPLLQRRRLTRRLPEQPGNPSKLRAHAGGNDDRRAPSCRHHRAGVEERMPVAERRVDRLGVGHALLCRQALAGERRLLRGETKSLHEPGIRRHMITGFDLDPVPDDQTTGGDRRGLPVTDHAGHWGRHRSEGGEGTLGAVFLEEADDGVDQDDRHDRGRVGPVADRSGDDRRHDQDPDQQLAELRQERPPPRHRGGLHQSVGAVLRQPPCRFPGCEPPLGVGLQSPHNLVDRAGVPGRERGWSTHLGLGREHRIAC